MVRKQVIAFVNAGDRVQIMTNEEKMVLKSAASSNEGQMSPATIINGYAKGNQGIVERLVSQGYLERIYHLKEGPHHGSHSIIFYAVTEKGYMVFAKPHSRLWFNIKNQITLYVAVASIMFGLIGVVTSFYTVKSSLQANKISNQVAQLEYDNKQPFLIVTGGNIDATSVNIQNAGGGPAKNIFFLKHYLTASATDAFIFTKNGNVGLALGVGQSSAVNLNETTMDHTENIEDVVGRVRCLPDGFLAWKNNWVSVFYENIQGERFVSKFNGMGAFYSDVVDFIKLKCDEQIIRK